MSDSLSAMMRGLAKRARSEAFSELLRRSENTSSPAQYKAFVRFAAHTGYRIGQARRLRWEGLDLDRAIMRVKSESGAYCAMPLSTQVVALLHGLERQGPYVFPSLRDARGEGSIG